MKSTLAQLIVSIAVTCVATMAAAADLPWQIRQQWNTDTTVKVYTESGAHNPKWDAAAKAVLEAAARDWSSSAIQNGDEYEVLRSTGDAALRAGCRDPLVMYAHARAMAYYGRKPADILKAEEGMVEGFRDSKYPAVRKYFGFGVAAETLMQAKPADASAKESAQSLAGEMMNLLPEIFADPRLPTDETMSVLDVAVRVSLVVNGSPQPLQDQAVAVLEKSIQPKSAILTARGNLAIKNGWRARGTGYANSVTRKGFDTLEKQTALARQLLLQSWASNPKEYETTIGMLNLELTGRGNRAEMEKWFKAAVAIDPQDYRAYHDKLNWLEPKWNGSVEEMIAFGRECGGLPWGTGQVPLILVDAHWQAGRYGPGGLTVAPHREYFKSDPKIFEEIKPVYEAYLLKNPSNYHQTRYAVIAAYSGQWKLATKMFRTMSWHDRSVAVLYDNKALDELVKESVAEYRKQWAADRANQDFPNKIVAARWGGGQKWADVTETVQFWVDDGSDVWADMETLQTDPTPGWKKHLEIMYTDKGKSKTISVNEGSKIPVGELR